MTSTKKSWLRTAGVGIGLAFGAVASVWALDAVTTSPTKIYTSVGGAISFAVTLPAGNTTSDTDLLVSYTANTGSPSITPYASCIDPATPAPYDGAPTKSKYVNWTAGVGIFPTAAACGSAAGAITLATFSGVATSIPGGAYTIQVLNGFSNGDTNVTANDVTICQKTTVSSITAPADAYEGTAQTFFVNFASPVPVGCGGFSIPVTLSGTATAAPDSVVITANNCTNIADSVSSCAVAVQGIDDTVVDGTKVATLTVTDSVASDVYVSAGKTANANVLDNESSIAVVAVRNGAEGGNSVQFSVSCSGPAANVAVNFAWSGTATQADFVNPLPTSVNLIPCGGTPFLIDLPVFDDSLVEGTESVTLTISTTSGGVAVAAGQGSATATIADNDTPPVFSVAQAGACAEAVTPTNCTFTITRDSGVSTATTVNFAVTGVATRGTDYVLKTGGCAAGTALTGNSISHPDANPLVIDVCVIDDLIVETGGETVIFTVTPNAPTYTVGTATQTQNIADDDSPQVVTVVGPVGPIPEAAGTGTFTFTRTGGSAAAQAWALTVNTGLTGTATFGATCATGVDYTSSAAGNTVTFAANSATATITVTACQDAVLDPAETIIYSVAAPTLATDYTVGSPASATGVIADDEINVTVTPNAVIEGNSVVFTINCSGPAMSSVTGLTFAVTPAQDAGAAAATPGMTGAVGTLTCGTPFVVTVPTMHLPALGDSRQFSLALTGPGAASTNGTVILPAASAVASVQDADKPLVVPTMSLLGLGFMSLMLAGFAAFQRRRVQK